MPLQVPPSAGGGRARCRGSMGRHQQVSTCFSHAQASAVGHFTALLTEVGVLEPVHLQLVNLHAASRGGLMSLTANNLGLAAAG